MFEGAQKGGGYEALAFAVIKRAALDYYDAKFYLDTLDERYIRVDVANKETRSEKLYRLRLKREKTVKEVEIFCKGPLFDLYSQGHLDGEKALEAMCETYDREIYPAMYEKFREDEWRSAVRRCMKYFQTQMEVYNG